MTHEAPPSTDQRPQKVAKVAEDDTPSTTAKPAAAAADVPADTPASNGNSDKPAATNGSSMNGAATKMQETAVEGSTKPEEVKGDTQAKAAAEPEKTTEVVATEQADAAGATTAEKADKEVEPSKNLTEISLKEYMSSSPKPQIANIEKLSEDKIEVVSDEKVNKFHDIVSERKNVCILLAAGQGSRFISDIPKVIHPLNGKPLAQYTLDSALENDLPIVIVVGHAKEQVAKTLIIPEDKKDQVLFVIQDKTMGTGHAVYIASTCLPTDYSGDIIVSYADNPGIDSNMLKSFVEAHNSYKTKYGAGKYGAMSITGSRKHAGKGAVNYGRIVREKKEDNTGYVIDIIEKKTINKLSEDNTNKVYKDSIEWTPKELDEIDEFNSGIVVACGKPYLNVLNNVKGSMTKKEPVVKYEYYATDFVKGLVSNGLIAEGYQVKQEDMWKLEGSNTVEELQELCVKMQKATSDTNNTTEGKAK